MKIQEINYVQGVVTKGRKEGKEVRKKGKQVGRNPVINSTTPLLTKKKQRREGRKRIRKAGQGRKEMNTLNKTQRKD